MTKQDKVKAEAYAEVIRLVREFDEAKVTEAIHLSNHYGTIGAVIGHHNSHIFRSYRNIISSDHVGLVKIAMRSYYRLSVKAVEKRKQLITALQTISEDNIWSINQSLVGLKDADSDEMLMDWVNDLHEEVNTAVDKLRELNGILLPLIDWKE